MSRSVYKLVLVTVVKSPCFAEYLEIMAAYLELILPMQRTVMCTTRCMTIWI